MQRLFFSLAWLLLASGLVFTSIAGLQLYYQAHAKNQTVALVPEPDSTAIYTPQANKPTGEVKGVETVVETDDARAELVSKFLERHDSPLTPYDYFGSKFVEISDHYGFDFRLLPAIAMQESNLCKSIPEGSYNCLGFGIHERGTLTFENFEANFERAGKELKKNYIDQGLTSPEEIMKKYTPSSDGSWAASVNQWMAEMRYDDHALGIELKKDADVMEFAKPTPAATASP